MFHSTTHIIAYKYFLEPKSKETQNKSWPVFQAAWCKHFIWPLISIAVKWVDWFASGSRRRLSCWTTLRIMSNQTNCHCQSTPPFTSSMPIRFTLLSPLSRFTIQSAKWSVDGMSAPQRRQQRAMSTTSRTCWARWRWTCGTRHLIIRANRRGVSF